MTKQRLYVAKNMEPLIVTALDPINVGRKSFVHVCALTATFTHDNQTGNETVGPRDSGPPGRVRATEMNWLD